MCTVFLEMVYRKVKWPQLVVEASMIKMRASEFRRLSHIERKVQGMCACGVGWVGIDIGC